MSHNVFSHSDPIDGQIVTFYSYKGGVGRTFALANIAAQLVKWNYKVLCIDWDLEAPGLEKYFSILSREVKAKSGLVDLLEHPSPNHDWREHVSTYRLPDECSLSHGVDLIRSGSDAENYVQRVQKLDWNKLYLEKDLGRVLEKMRREWKSEYDFVLIDSRTGVTDIGGICTVQLPDILVPLMTANHQNLNGSNDVIRRANESRNKFEFDRGGLLVMPVLSRFDSREEYEQAKKWRRLFVEKIGWTIDVWRDHHVNHVDIANHLVVPYFSYWSFGERLPVVEDNIATSDSIKYSFQTLASLLAKNLSKNSKLVKSRDSYVASADRSNPAPTNFDVFVSYQSRDRQQIDFTNQVSKALQASGATVFYDVENIRAGDDWRQATDNAFQNSRVVLFLLTDLNSKWQMSELRMAEQSDSKIVVVFFKSKDTLNIDIESYFDLERVPVIEIDEKHSHSDVERISREVQSQLAQSSSPRK